MGLTLGEGNTPLVHAERLSAELGLDLHLKLEGSNPTGSFKDRGMAVAVGRAKERGARAVVCASTGNTAASAAAYAARAGLRAIVLTPAGATAGPKRAQTRAVGAELVEVDGTFDDALRLCRELGEQDGYVLVNSINPDRLDGQKGVVAEIVRQLGRVPDVIALPFGGGGNVSAVAKGLDEEGLDVRVVVGQAEQRPTTWASAIRIGQPAHTENVNRLVESGRVEVATLSEAELRESWQLVAATEGAFCEPASGAGVGALKKLGVTGVTAVAILTGHGLKDTAAVTEETHTVAPTLDAVLGAVE